MTALQLTYKLPNYHQFEEISLWVRKLRAYELLIVFDSRLIRGGPAFLGVLDFTLRLCGELALLREVDMMVSAILIL